MCVRVGYCPSLHASHARLGSLLYSNRRLCSHVLSIARCVCVWVSLCAGLEDVQHFVTKKNEMMLKINLIHSTCTSTLDDDDNIIPKSN